MKFMYFCPSCNQKCSFESDLPSHKVRCPDCHKAMGCTGYSSDEFKKLSETEQGNILDKLRQTIIQRDRSKVKTATILGPLLCAILVYLLNVDNPNYFKHEWWEDALNILFVIVFCIIGGFFLNMISILFSRILFCKMIHELDKEDDKVRSIAWFIPTKTFLEKHEVISENLNYVSLIVVFLICVIIIRFSAIIGI